jgi:hypothetical protein
VPFRRLLAVGAGLSEKTGKLEQEVLRSPLPEECDREVIEAFLSLDPPV